VSSTGEVKVTARRKMTEKGGEERGIITKKRQNAPNTKDLYLLYRLHYLQLVPGKYVKTFPKKECRRARTEGKGSQKAAAVVTRTRAGTVFLFQKKRTCMNDRHVRGKKGKARGRKKAISGKRHALPAPAAAGGHGKNRTPSPSSKNPGEEESIKDGTSRPRGL